MRHLTFALLTIAGVTCVANGSPYMVSWSAADGLLPENSDPAWERVWGDWDGPYHGTGAERTFHDGVLTYDSLNDRGVVDFNQMYRPGQLDPGPNEWFTLEFGLRVLEVDGTYDHGAGFESDDAWSVSLAFGQDRLYSLGEGYLQIPFTAGVFHAYRIVSSSMRTYDLYIDDVLRHRGVLDQIFFHSRVSWGDGVQGGASRADWSYVRFGVVPEPASLSCLAIALACCVGRRAFPLPEEG